MSDTAQDELVAYLRLHHPGVVERAEEDLDAIAGGPGRVNAELIPILDEWDAVRGDLARGTAEPDPDALQTAIRIIRLIKTLHSRYPINGDLRVQMVIRQMEARGFGPLINLEEGDDVD